ncbi:hypothetical protein A7985_14220 [Pseudoalteromonas luteoviolacea]|uniref:Uncharacterized protein n=2 Tax=Pseudoalteromonas luteoviolacea TaxID=43657 RepID=A0A1C0TPT3_9GAMM|nr:DUF3718 domain-containing protein [Pseudoalteromonas luteoviolacea]KZN56118.1 hypothetical protein N474_12625 [Pseudoalteromonas luteoviolacea CPMOR-2]MBQ4811910.1 DUF3718 domain-containing protein [Pseudoalteromonas luteoviolacea]OCQ20943.1 hypothetical protein A7985_14220 [Pseudoalteromonas luteoviolacea]TQF66723.1 DUF3718 domain-containing protein [Pseudoalteromonas luteoviolacea]
MKFVPVLLSVSMGLGAFSLSFETKANDQLAVTLCEYIAVDDKGRVRKALKSSRVKIRNVFDAIECNGNNMLRHAIASNAVETGKLIVKGLPKSALADGADIAWAESNGHGGSPLIAEIKKRAGL